MLDLFETGLFENLFINPVNDDLLRFELIDIAGNGDHDLRIDLFLGFEKIGRCLKNGANLHLGNFRISNTQTNTAMTHHGVELMELFAAFDNVGNRDTKALGQLLLHALFLRYELMERGVEKTDGNMKAFHNSQSVLNVLFDIDGQLFEIFNALCLSAA